MLATIVIVTLERPESLRLCLERLHDQEPQPHEIIVVDASRDNLTRDLVQGFPSVRYLRTAVGYGHMTESRNLGIAAAEGDVVAFLDDDAYPRPGWLGALLAQYSPGVGGVGGRSINHPLPRQPPRADHVGRVEADGRLTANFDSAYDSPLLVDHLIGCNMSFRRDALLGIGGFRDHYTGTEVREEADVCLRIRAAGHRIVWTPSAVVDHHPARQHRGQRFDLRYGFFAQRNHAVLLMTNFGMTSPKPALYAFATVFELLQRIWLPSPPGSKRWRAAGRGLVELAGLLWGMAVGARWRLTRR